MGATRDDLINLYTHRIAFTGKVRSRVAENVKRIFRERRNGREAKIENNIFIKNTCAHSSLCYVARSITQVTGDVGAIGPTDNPDSKSGE
jgi:hypothetical protein